MQKTTFDYEVIVSDDGSDDGSIDILLAYKEKYSSIIRIIEGGHLGGTANLKRVIEASDAKYIALCDGDDYWTDAYKLQKQVDFLEANTEYVGCFHNVINRYEGGRNADYFHPIDFKPIHDWKSFVLDKWFIPDNGEMFRREHLYFPLWYGEMMNDDYVINLMLAKSGPFYYMPDVMAVYRHHAGNESNSYADEILINRNLLLILEKAKKEYPVFSLAVFDEKIEWYNYHLLRLERLRKYPWLKYLNWRIYKRWLFGILKIRRC